MIKYVCTPGRVKPQTHDIIHVLVSRNEFNFMQLKDQKNDESKRTFHQHPMDPEAKKKKSNLATIAFMLSNIIYSLNI